MLTFVDKKNLFSFIYFKFHLCYYLFYILNHIINRILLLNLYMKKFDFLISKCKMQFGTQSNYFVALRCKYFPEKIERWHMKFQLERYMLYSCIIFNFEKERTKKIFITIFTDTKFYQYVLYKASYLFWNYLLIFFKAIF